MTRDNVVERLDQVKTLGRGKKRCPNCGEICGVRTLQCKCQYEFGKSKVTKKTVHHSEGRGKKCCPDCGKVTGVRTLRCSCNYEFRKSKAVKIKTVVYSLPGRGRKYCEGCKQYVGIKNLLCPSCGYEFKPQPQVVKKIKEVPLNTSVEDEAKQFLKNITNKEAILGSNVILVPSGQCPIQLKNIDILSVRDWCEALLVYGKEQGKVYTPSALRYFASQFYNSDEHKEVVCYINNWVTSKRDISQTILGEKENDLQEEI